MADAPPTGPPPSVRAWAPTEPSRLIGKGHPAGDFLEAWRWEVLEESDGHLRLRAQLPDHVKNPRPALRRLHPHLHRPRGALHRALGQ